MFSTLQSIFRGIGQVWTVYFYSIPLLFYNFTINFKFYLITYKNNRKKINNFNSSLADTIGVSMYGSQLGIIHGETGQWISNITGKIFDIFQNIRNAEYFCEYKNTRID